MPPVAFSASVEDGTPAIAEPTGSPASETPTAEPTEPTLPPAADTVLPVVTVPGTISVTADAATGMASVNFDDQISAVDDVDGPVPVIATPPSGDFPVGDTTVTVIATDAAGNVGSASFVVSVSRAPEPTAPATEEPTVAPTGAPAATTAATPSPSKAGRSSLAAAAAGTPMSVYYRLKPQFAGPVRNVEWRIYDNMDGAGEPINRGTIVLDFFSNTIPTKVLPGQSIAVTAPDVSGYPFLNWSSVDTGEIVTSQTVVQANDGTGGTLGWQANYAIPEVTLTGNTMTAVFNTSAALSATLTKKDGTPISYETISFTLNGVTKTATAGAGGIATLSGANLMPLTGLTKGKSYAFTVRLTGSVNYQDATGTGTVRIGDSATLTLGPIDTYVYDGTPKPRVVTTTPAGLSGVSVTYTGSSVTYGPTTTPPTGLGNYMVTAQLDNPDYAAAPAKGSLYVVKNPAPVTITINDLAQTYDGTPRPVTVTTNPVLPASDITVTYNGSTAAPTNAGTYTVKVVLAYYTTTKQANLVVARAPVTVTADAKTKKVGDADPPLTYQITSGALAGTDKFTGALTRAPGEAVGTYAITKGSLALNANYALTFVGANLIISPIIVTITPEDGQGKVYGAEDPALTFTNDAGIPQSAFTGALSRATGENVGSYSITIGTLSVGANYALVLSSTEVTFAITPLAVTVSAEPKAKTFGAADPELTFRVSPALVGEDAFTGTLSRAAGEDVDTYVITQGDLALGSNYTLTFVGADLTISRATVTITPDMGQNKVYGKPDLPLTFTNDTGLEAAAFSGELSRASGDDVGTYAITLGTLDAGKNYALVLATAPVEFAITPLAITVTADSQTKVYGSDDPVLSYTVSEGKLVGEDKFTGALTRALGENVGTYEIKQGTLALTGNYQLTVIGANLTITERPVTVTAESKTKTWGDADPTLTYKVTSGSKVDGDEFEGALHRAPGETEGVYAIDQGNLTLNSNYTLTFVGATFTIQGKLAVTLIPVKDSYANGSTVQIRFKLARNGKEVTRLDSTMTVTMVIQGVNSMYSLTAGAMDITYDPKSGTWIYKWSAPTLAKKTTAAYSVMVSFAAAGATSADPATTVLNLK